jgi:type IV pilus assembly protein PilB
MNGFSKKNFEDVILEAGVITQDQLNKAKKLKNSKGITLEESLVALGYLSQEELMGMKAKAMNVEYINLNRYVIRDDRVLSLVPESLARKYKAIPLERVVGNLVVAMEDPTDIYAIEDIGLATDLNIKPVLGEGKKIKEMINTYYYSVCHVVSDDNDVIDAGEIKKAPLLIDEEALEAIRKMEEEFANMEKDANEIKNNIESKVGKLENKPIEKQSTHDQSAPVDNHVEECQDEVLNEDSSIGLEETQPMPSDINFENVESANSEINFEEEVETILEEDTELTPTEEVVDVKNEDSEDKPKKLTFRESIKNSIEASLKKGIINSNTEEKEILSDVEEENPVKRMIEEIEQSIQVSEDDKLELGDSGKLDIDNTGQIKFEEENLNLEQIDDSILPDPNNPEVKKTMKEELIRELKLKEEEQIKKEEQAKIEPSPMGVEINNSSIVRPIVEPASSAASSVRNRLFKQKLGDILVKSGVLTEDMLMQALKKQKESGGKLGEVLVKEGYIEKKELYNVLQMQLKIPYMDLEGIEFTPEIIKLVSATIAKRYRLIPLSKEGNVLKVAMSDPTNVFSIDDVKLATGLEINPVIADEDKINELIEEFYSKKKSGDDLEEEMKRLNEEIAIDIKKDEDEQSIDDDISGVDNAPIVKLVNVIIQTAITRNSSDIHIEPTPNYLLVRNRIDGYLHEVMKQELRVAPSLIARIKIISGLNIAEKRLPQDGRISITFNNKEYDLRVSVLPVVYGEKVVIRIADKGSFKMTKQELGLLEDDMAKFNQIISYPHGMVLVTGPTGSGKTTTLYTVLSEISKPSVNVLTVEDPVEATIKGTNQVHVNMKAGLDFAAALRSFLRQDPDIIMVGEIRDSETAQIANRAAITGHLVLSTLHTNDAPNAITRLIDMGIEPFMLSSSIVGVMAQRLVRKLCAECKEKVEPTVADRKLLMSEGDDCELYIAKGCPKCNNTGYRGRIAVYEIMTINENIRNLVAQRATGDMIKNAALENGMKTLRDNCIRLISTGVTTVEELYRVISAKD